MKTVEKHDIFDHWQRVENEGWLAPLAAIEIPRHRVSW